LTQSQAGCRSCQFTCAVPPCADPDQPIADGAFTNAVKGNRFIGAPALTGLVPDPVPRLLPEAGTGGAAVAAGYTNARLRDCGPDDGETRRHRGDHPVKEPMRNDGTMMAMLLDAPGKPLREARVPVPAPGDQEVLIKVSACGVCRTDLHIIDGELHPPRLPLILGHEVVGAVVQTGSSRVPFAVGQRVGIPWLGGTCGHCAFCTSGRENLCDTPVFTGFDRDGGYAEFVVADSRYCLAIPERYDDVHAAPLLCAGLIGYRAYAMTGGARRLGLYGFGAAAHIIAQVALQQGKEIHALTRPGDTASQAFARKLGATWAGDSDATAPAPLDAAILFAPAGALVPRALAATCKGGTVVCAGIHMSDIPSFPYSLLWGERVVRSVANLTRADGAAFLALAQRIDIKVAPLAFPLREANEALCRLR
jgi:propanol-preferring alcohol dehydrogenase